ncbi:MAG TPA: AAA family ATPase [Solirubrobacteraceae bacterium]|nr:AAA family ATPase [Solirubrobacteraceae bacterium]
MHLKSITIAGFKSFPDRTRLEFGEGVSVIVGPNGSGKSNITDAVLWALGEQSPLAVRGQSMQDVIFAGGRGVASRNSAEVELVLDNSDATIDIGASELSITRRYNRAGEGEYRLNGTQCRLVDVLELLSDTGLGKEAHSVISQGRVEAIVTSRPRDRRLLIEEAAGLGKHRKRRRRAQLKLERTEENLDRALDVEREARARLRPLKRQAEAAELHERLERQSLEARWTLTRDDLRVRRARLASAETQAATARGARGELEAEITEVAGRREQAEEALGQRSERHDAISRRAFSVRSAQERIALRLERGRALGEDLEERARRRATELELLREAAAGEEESPSGRVAALETELAALAEQHLRELAGELEALETERSSAAAAALEREGEREQRRLEAGLCETAVAQAREGLLTAEREIEAARREAASVGADLAAVNQFLRTHAAAGPSGGADLESALTVEPGYELALAATLGGRLAAAVVSDRSQALGVIDAARDGDARALVAPPAAAPPSPGTPPSSGARPLLDLLRGEPQALAVAARLLADTWVVDDLESLGDAFTGVAVTRAGRVWSGALGELRQVASGGRERALEQRNRREALVTRSEQAASAEHSARARLAEAQAQVQSAVDAREAADALLRAADRAHGDSVEAERRAAWLIEQRRAAPEQGEIAVRRAQLAGELAAERRALERADRERRARAERIAVLEAQTERAGALAPAIERFAAACAALAEPVEALLGAIDEELRADSAAGEALAAGLRECASAESALQARLRELAETVTTAEVAAQQSRDQAAESEAELGSLAGRLGLEALPAEEELGEEGREALRERVERLARRRELLGPVNPLAAEEYREALERVETLEAQRTDLEAALRELRTLIATTDREIAENFEQTFAAAAANFEALVADVFPGGRGRLRLVSDEPAPRAVLGGQQADGASAADAESGAEEEAAAAEEAADGYGPGEQLGVEIEVTPAGKSMKRLSLLSGGEKSMTAIAFLFAVFLARPCPFYILDEVEAALDDLNIDRFLTLLRRHSTRAQFIVVTHQKRTMEAADWLYGVSMAGDGTSKVVSRRLGAAGLEEVTADAA